MDDVARFAELICKLTDDQKSALLEDMRRTISARKYFRRDHAQSSPPLARAHEAVQPSHSVPAD